MKSEAIFHGAGAVDDDRHSKRVILTTKTAGQRPHVLYERFRGYTYGRVRWNTLPRANGERVSDVVQTSPCNLCCSHCTTSAHHAVPTVIAEDVGVADVVPYIVPSHSHRFYGNLIGRAIVQHARNDVYGDRS